MSAVPSGQAEDWASLRLGGEQPGHSPGAWASLPTCFAPSRLSRVSHSSGPWDCPQERERLKVVFADPSNPDGLEPPEGRLGEGERPSSFSFNRASSKAQTDCHAVCSLTLSYKPRKRGL